MPILSRVAFCLFRSPVWRSCLMGVVLGLTACTQTGALAPVETEAPPASSPEPERIVPSPPAEEDQKLVVSSAQLERGGGIYAQYCAGCHGKNAEGTPAGPSLDGSGHTWHHPLHVLHRRTKDGFRQMPGYSDRLTDSEVDDVIVWFQSLWPASTYASWKKHWYGSEPVSRFNYVDS